MTIETAGDGPDRRRCGKKPQPQMEEDFGVLYPEKASRPCMVLRRFDESQALSSP